MTYRGSLSIFLVRLLQVGLLLVGLLLGSCAQQAPFIAVSGAVGEIESAAGFPSVMRNARPYIVDERSRIYNGDILRTDQRSSMSARLASGGSIHISPNTQLRVNLVKQRGTDFQSEFSLNAGAIRALVIMPLKLRTSVAEVSAAYGNFWVGYDNPELSVIALDNADVTISNTDGAVVLNEKLEGSTTRPGTAPGSVSSWSRERAENTMAFHNKVR